MCNKINIQKLATFTPDANKLQLVVFRLTKVDSTPYNFVWIMGNIDKVKHKLFAWNGTQFERTYFGTIYNATLPKDNTRIEVNTTKLSALCRDLNIDSLVIVRFQLY